MLSIPPPDANPLPTTPQAGSAGDESEAAPSGTEALVSGKRKRTAAAKDKVRAHHRNGGCACAAATSVTNSLDSLTA
jgi:hypothetical protein